MKNYWLDRKALREVNPIIDFNKPCPHIYGYKTPDKHVIKFELDDAPVCEKQWKRMEMISQAGHSWVLKELDDDNLPPWDTW